LPAFRGLLNITKLKKNLHVTLGKINRFFTTVHRHGTLYRFVVHLVTVVITTKSLWVAKVLSQWIHVYIEVAVFWTKTAVFCSDRSSRWHYDLKTLNNTLESIYWTVCCVGFIFIFIHHWVWQQENRNLTSTIIT